MLAFFAFEEFRFGLVSCSGLLEPEVCFVMAAFWALCVCEGVYLVLVFHDLNLIFLVCNLFFECC